MNSKFLNILILLAENILMREINDIVIVIGGMKNSDSVG